MHNLLHLFRAALTGERNRTGSPALELRLGSQNDGGERGGEGTGGNTAQGGVSGIQQWSKSGRLNQLLLS